MNFYKNIEINYNYEEWRFNRLKSVIDNLDQSLLNNLAELEDDKGILKVYYKDPFIITVLQRLWIKHLWYEENEDIVKFIKYIKRADSPPFCPYCSDLPKPKEDNDDQFKYIDFNTNI
jgi:hypothetical protein